MKESRILLHPSCYNQADRAIGCGAGSRGRAEVRSISYPGASPSSIRLLPQQALGGDPKGVEGVAEETELFPKDAVRTRRSAILGRDMIHFRVSTLEPTRPTAAAARGAVAGCCTPLGGTRRPICGMDGGKSANLQTYVRTAAGMRRMFHPPNPPAGRRLCPVRKLTDDDRHATDWKHRKCGEADASVCCEADALEGGRT
jgi:hypothetical protein